MASHGGARNRSGPKADPNSARSDARNYTLQTLPADGYKGEPPAFPLPRPTKRERDVWAWIWSTPQACAWALPQESWRTLQVAHYVRVMVRCEDHEAPVGLFAQMARLADQIGMSTAGLAEMGWQIKPDELREKRAESKGAKRGSARDRMKVAGSG